MKNHIALDELKQHCQFARQYTLSDIFTEKFKFGNNKYLPSLSTSTWAATSSYTQHTNDATPEKTSLP
jgi:hypothetical protein